MMYKQRLLAFYKKHVTIFVKTELKNAQDHDF